MLIEFTQSGLNVCIPGGRLSVSSKASFNDTQICVCLLAIAGKNDC